MVERLAERLEIEVPTIFIANEGAVNAFSAYSGQKAVVFYTEGFLSEFDLARDQPLIEAVTAHLLTRTAAGDNALTVAAAGLLDWALFLFNTVVAGFAYILGKLGIAYIKSDAHKRLMPGPPPYGDDMINRLIVWGISVFIGLWLLMAAVVVVLTGGILVAVAGGVRMGLSRQRIRIADSIAVEMVGDPQALGAAFARFAGIDRPDGRPIDLDSKKRVLHELCFHDSSRYFPGLAGRATATSGSARTAKPGALTPVASGLALVCLLAGIAILTTRIPYGHPFGSAVAVGGQQYTSTANSASRQSAPAGTQEGQQTQPGPGQSSADQPSLTTSQSPGSGHQARHRHP